VPTQSHWNRVVSMADNFLKQRASFQRGLITVSSSEADRIWISDIQH